MNASIDYGVLHKCARCYRYYSCKEPSTPCRYHPGAFVTGAGTATNGVMGYSAGVLPEWKCCGASEQCARGCQEAEEHVLDLDFEEAASVFGKSNRQTAVRNFPPSSPPKPSSAPPPATPHSAFADRKPTAKEALLGWKQVPVTRDDTLVGLALKHGVEPGLLRQANRLADDGLLLSHSTLLVPPAGWYPSAGSTPQASSALGRVVREGKVSREEARYYLELAGGNPEAALAECRSDQQWEATSEAAQPSIDTTPQDGGSLRQELLNPADMMNLI